MTASHIHIGIEERLACVCLDKSLRFFLLSFTVLRYQPKIRLYIERP
jgi:hypothetical protein